MKFHQQIGTADIGSRITTACVGPIDDDGLRSFPQDVHRVKVAVAQAVAVWHIRNSVE
jgi:hypothetical protein